MVIEVDGDTHADPKQAEYDAERTEWLNAQKHYRVIRFWNSEILHGIEDVLVKIAEMIGNQLTN